MSSPGLLAVSDVMGTGWWAADAAEVEPGSTAVVVGAGAVGLCGVIAAKELGAQRSIAMSRHESRQELARAFGATARAFARAGAAVGLADIDETAVANAAKEFADAGRRALALLCGPTDEDQAAAAVDRTVETFGRLGTACTALGHHCDH